MATRLFKLCHTVECFGPGVSFRISYVPSIHNLIAGVVWNTNHISTHGFGCIFGG